ncbi:zinc-binding dehydrogenase [Arthrobacter sp. JZ12]|uniref:zinc-binding dehydrogenase n=1 Tax=Arthrobacter sp. JZ12 TaxID=2654190 RepID=UPI002B4657D1|nr:zinc-binding dehydrogenase [Arthrobacter sp. JZ12]WRH26248.1 zinc-binding dehydrogenase [Arthrobacter sp. JZ12]
MRAAYMPEPGRIAVGDFPVPEARGEGQVVVRMEAASICGSDIHNIFDGFHNPAAIGRPGYPGHEGIGTVSESRSSLFEPGDRVLTVPMGRDGACFAEYQLIPDAYLLPVPDGVEIPKALMAQQYGTTLYAMRLFWPDEGRSKGTCAIIGAGSAGLFFIQLAKRIGFAQILVSDLSPERLSVAKELGADIIVHAPNESIVDAVAAATGGEGADLVIEAAGYDQCRADAIAAVRMLGVVGFFGFPERLGNAPFPQYDAFRKVARIQWAGATQAEPGLVSFRDALRDISAGRIDVDYCLGEQYSLEDLPQAVEAARHQSHGKVKIVIDLT